MFWSILSYIGVTYLLLWIFLLPGFVVKFALNPPFYVEGTSGIVRASYSIWLASILYPIHFYYAAKNSKKPEVDTAHLIDIGEFDEQ